MHSQNILIQLLFLAAPVFPLAAPMHRQASAFGLQQYINDEFVTATELLSPDGIVEMLPKEVQSFQNNDISYSNGSSSSYRPPLRQEMFASPLISVLYERVLPPLWAAGLRIGGPDKEYQNAVSYLLQEESFGNNGSDKVVALDLSCGTGFVGIRMAKSGKFGHVFALDYSRQMLNEAVATVQREKEVSGGPSSGKDFPLSIIRGDAGSLPFKDGCIDAVHWGAAMHCVPDAEKAIAEVYRVLKPGGKLYATTFLRPFPDVVFRFFDLRELEDIAQGAGFGTDDEGGELEVEALRRVYGVIRARKGG